MTLSTALYKPFAVLSTPVQSLSPQFSRRFLMGKQRLGFALCDQARFLHQKSCQSGVSATESAAKRSSAHR